jgi:hypothetical protein
MTDLEVPRAQEVLRRAVQLDRTRQAEEGLTAEALSAAAAELGLHPESVALALAEQRAGGPRPTRSRRVADRVIGKGEVTAARTVAIAGDEADRLLRDWLERGHHLRAHRRSEGTLVAHRRTDLAGSVGRVVRRALEGEGGLGTIRELRVGSASTEGCAALCMQADVGDKRAGSVVTGGVVSAVGVAAMGMAAVATGPLVLVASPAALAVGWVVARAGHRSTVHRVGEELTRTIDAVATGRPPASLAWGLGRSMARAQQRSASRADRR